ncbi:hypothetical protein CN527_21020 [Bacillus cereus]|nr:hypothetical protein CN527_21020 [Bacillus cereus]
MGIIVICDCCNKKKGTHPFTFSPYAETNYYCENCYNELILIEMHEQNSDKNIIRLTHKDSK